MVNIVAAGERILRMRRSLAMTQRELAQSAGLTHATIVRIERGAHVPTLSSVRRIAQVLGVAPSELID